MSEPTTFQLMRKIHRAEMLLETVDVPRVPCKMTCPADDDTGHPAACTCGAEALRSAIAAMKAVVDKARAELRVDP